MTTIAISSRHGGLGRVWLLALGALMVVGCTTTDGRISTGAGGPSSIPTTESSPEPGVGLIAPDGSPGVDGPAGGSGVGGVPVDQPVAATLPWLAGAMTDGGLLLPGPAGQRWHGRLPGEHAEIYDDGYRYFGADGSAVQCASGGACVAVLADGSVVVLAERDGVRRLFAPDGSDLGLYTAAGDPISEEELLADGLPTPATEEPIEAETDPNEKGADSPDGGDAARPFIPDANRREALAEVDVDVADLVNAMTLQPPFAGGVTGDPHMVTASGIRYSAQGIGQFVARSGDADRQIQLEFSLMPHRTDVSIVTAAAIHTGADAITITHTGLVTIDGRPQVPPGAFDQIVLADGVAVGRWPADETGTGSVVIWWPDGSEVTAHTHQALGVTLIAAMPVTDQLSGLFGDGGQELVPRNGRAGGSAQSFVATWRATGSESLFAEPADGSGFGTDPVIDPGAQKIAAQWCAVPALTRSQDTAACAFDIAVTGDTGFLAGHITLATAVAADRAPGAFAAQWPALSAGARANAEPLPADGHIAATLDPQTARGFRFAVERAGAITLTHRAGCPADADPPTIDAPAVRIFDARGHAVSDRAPWCGQLTTGPLPKGDYLVVAATGPRAEQFTGDVVLP